MKHSAHHHHDLDKRREIVFSKFPPGQIPEAADRLGKLERLAATPTVERRSVDVRYNLADYTLLELENHLEDQGFHLDNTLFSKLLRALAHYTEEVQLRSLHAPERRLKNSSEAYVKAWERHQHGDHDDTPPEWREYK